MIKNKFFSKLSSKGIKSKDNKYIADKVFKMYFQKNKPCWSDKNYTNFSQEAYCKNVISHRAISMIASNAASVELLFYKTDIYGDKTEVSNDKIFNKIKNNPNPMQDKTLFFENIISNYLISGNAYIQIIKNNNSFDLFSLRPDRVSISQDEKGYPNGYTYTVNKNTIYQFKKQDNLSQILHIKKFNPLNDLYGMSSIEPAMFAIEQHNEIVNWNKSILERGGRPSGAIIVEDEKNQHTLTNEQYERLKSEIDDKISGSDNAGKVMLLEGGMKWQEMSINHKDMDFIENKNSAARDIALAFGVPPQLLGIKGDNTYNTFAEAKMSFWEETILPTLNTVLTNISKWLSCQFNQQIEITYDIDKISALNLKREKLWNNANNATFLTTNEKREMLGFISTDN